MRSHDTHVSRQDDMHVNRPDGDDPAVREPLEAKARGPEEPTQMPARTWLTVLKRSTKEFKSDELSDRAAALTYFGVLAVFPARLVGVAILGLLGPSATRTGVDNVQKLAPGALRDMLLTAVPQA